MLKYSSFLLKADKTAFTPLRILVVMSENISVLVFG